LTRLLLFILFPTADFRFIVGFGVKRVVVGAGSEIHVRLAAANPNITHHHIVEGQRVFTTDRHDGRVRARLHRDEFDAPGALFVGKRRLGLTREGDGHFLSRFRRAKTDTGMPLCRTIWSSKIGFSFTSALADTEANKIAVRTDNVFMILIPFIVNIALVAESG
jgi:hypothetical protein